MAVDPKAVQSWVAFAKKKKCISFPGMVAEEGRSSGRSNNRETSEPLMRERSFD